MMVKYGKGFNTQKFRKMALKNIICSIFVYNLWWILKTLKQSAACKNFICTSLKGGIPQKKITYGETSIVHHPWGREKSDLLRGWCPIEINLLYKMTIWDCGNVTYYRGSNVDFFFFFLCNIVAFFKSWKENLLFFWNRIFKQKSGIKSEKFPYGFT